MEDVLNSDNSKLLLLIDEWLKEDGKGKTYENVILELLNGNSSLFVQTHGEQVNETRAFIADENTNIKMGIYEIAEKKYFGAFTELDLLENWLKVRGSYVQLQSKTLLEMAYKTGVDGIIINSSYRNMFVVFRK
jgi:hypothetical protein